MRFYNLIHVTSRFICEKKLIRIFLKVVTDLINLDELVEILLRGD